MLTLKELKKRVPVAENCGLVMGSVELLHSGAEIVVTAFANPKIYFLGGAG